LIGNPPTPRGKDREDLSRRVEWFRRRRTGDNST